MMKVGFDFFFGKGHIGYVTLLQARCTRQYKLRICGSEHLVLLRNVQCNNLSTNEMESSVFSKVDFFNYFIPVDRTSVTFHKSLTFYSVSNE